MEEDLDHAREEAAAIRRRYDAVAARKDVLEKENKNMKQSVKTLLEKTENDDRLVEALREELRKLKRAGGGGVGSGVAAGKSKGAAPATAKPGKTASLGGAGRSDASGANAAGNGNSALMKAYAELQAASAKKDLIIKNQNDAMKDLEEELNHCREQRPSSSSSMRDAKAAGAQDDAEVQRMIDTWREQLSASQNRCDSLMRQLHKERMKVIDLEKQKSSSSSSVGSRTAAGAQGGSVDSKSAADEVAHVNMMNEMYSAMERMKLEHEREIEMMRAALASST